MKAALYVLVLGLCAPYEALAATVTRVLDGDTIEVKNLPDNMLAIEIPVRVRLNGIDAPEKRQPYGQRSKQYLTELIGGKSVTVAIDGHDRYNRILGDVSVLQCLPKCETVSVNAAMVKAGMAWAYRYNDVAVSPPMAELEASARSQGLGLWHDKTAVEPWKWRHTHLNQ